MITAQEARQYLESIQQKKMDSELVKVEKAIMTAINNDMDNITTSLSPKTKNKLEELGYTVTSLDDPRDQSTDDYRIKF